MRGLIWRGIATVAVLSAWGFTYNAYNTVATLTLGEAAGAQFQPSDKAAFEWSVMNNAFFHIDGLFSFGVPLLIILIWGSYLVVNSKKLGKWINEAMS